jgi:hypothetical protein
MNLLDFCSILFCSVRIIIHHPMRAAMQLQ